MPSRNYESNYGAGGQDRTDDLLFTKQLLYQLSYASTTKDMSK